MKKIEKFLVNNTISVVLFLFSFISLLFSIFIFTDYLIINDIYHKEINEISYVEGNIEKVTHSKTNINIIVKKSKKILYIHDKYIDINLVKNDEVKIYYSDNSFFRGNYYKIVQLEVNNSMIYTFSEYKENNNPHIELIGFCVCIIFTITLIIIGIIKLSKSNKNKNQYELTTEQINEIIGQLSFDDSKIDVNYNETYDKLKQSIYTKNNRYYTSALELIESFKIGEIFFEVLADMVSESEMKVIFDDAYRDDSAIYVIYKINNKTAVLSLFEDEFSKKFIINKETLYFMFPKDSKPNNDEYNLFIKQLERYNLFDKIFEIEKK